MRQTAFVVIGAGLLLASCGRPDASGIYVSASDRQVVLVQLVEKSDGTITGRLEQLTIDPSGNIKDQIIPLDGAASGRDLLFKPAGAWYGGLQASGHFTLNGISISGGGNSFNAARSSLDGFKNAVTRLQATASDDRQRLADAREKRARMAAILQQVTDTANKVTALRDATATLTSDTARLDQAIVNCPDFGQRSASNTAKVEKMLQLAPRLSTIQRGQLGVAANQVEVGTNQIEVARSQYAIGLNQIVQAAKPLAEQIVNFCNSAPSAQFGDACVSAKASADTFAQSLQRGQKVFLPYKQAVQAELDRQAALVRTIDRLN